MEIQLTKGTAQLKVNIDGQSYSLIKPKVGLVKKFDAMKKEDGFKAIELLIISMGLPQEVFDNLEIDQLEQITDGVMALLLPKKNSPSLSSQSAG